MFRARLASLTLAAGMLAVTGCNTCGGSGFRPFHRNQTHSDCGCGQPVVVGSAPSDGPMLFPQDASILPPAATPPTSTPPPRIVPVPQAAPFQYQPTGLRRLFDRNP